MWGVPNEPGGSLVRRLDQACPSPSWVWASLSGLLSAWGRTRSLPLERKKGELASWQEWLLHLFASCSREHLSLQLSKNVNVLWPCVTSWKRPSIPTLGSVSWIGGLMMLRRVKSLAHEDSLPSLCSSLGPFLRVMVGFWQLWGSCLYPWCTEISRCTPCSFYTHFSEHLAGPCSLVYFSSGNFSCNFYLIISLFLWFWKS